MFKIFDLPVRCPCDLICIVRVFLSVPKEEAVCIYLQDCGDVSVDMRDQSGLFVLFLINAL